MDEYMKILIDLAIDSLNTNSDKLWKLIIKNAITRTVNEKLTEYTGLIYMKGFDNEKFPIDFKLLNSEITPMLNIITVQAIIKENIFIKTTLTDIIVNELTMTVRFKIINNDLIAVKILNISKFDIDTLLNDNFDRKISLFVKGVIEKYTKEDVIIKSGTPNNFQCCLFLDNDDKFNYELIIDNKIYYLTNKNPVNLLIDENTCILKNHSNCIKLLKNGLVICSVNVQNISKFPFLKKINGGYLSIIRHNLASGEVVVGMKGLPKLEVSFLKYKRVLKNGKETSFHINKKMNPLDIMSLTYEDDTINFCLKEIVECNDNYFGLKIGNKKCFILLKYNIQPADIFKIKEIKCTNLKNNNIFTSFNPYVILEYNNKIIKIDEKKNTLNPWWYGDIFKSHLENHNNYINLLLCTSEFWSDCVFGSSVIDLRSDKIVQILKGDRSVGQVSVETKFINYPYYIINIEEISCSVNESIIDLIFNKNHIFVQFVCDGIVKTESKYGTPDPVWKNLNISLNYESLVNTISVQVMSKNDLSFVKLLGETKIKTKDIVQARKNNNKINTVLKKYGIKIGTITLTMYMNVF